MTPAWWHTALPSFLWQAMLHSTVLGLIFYAWARRVELPSGRTKRRLLAILLVLPLVTAAIPGRAGLEFRGRAAWLDSGRVLAVPLFGGLHLYHLALVIAAMMTLITLWQEVAPLARRLHTGAAEAPDRLVRLVHALPGWADCAVVLTPTSEVQLATSGWPRRPRLIVSEGALARLSDDELAAVVRHEHAHRDGGRWVLAHVLFVFRLLQSHSPVALWAFREYCVELEVECDAAATAGRDPKILARVLLARYGLAHGRDVAMRSTLRKRIDVLIDPAAGTNDDLLPVATIAVASLMMLAVLPWIV